MRFSIQMAVISWLATTLAFAIAGTLLLENNGFSVNSVVLGTIVYLILVLPCLLITGAFYKRNKVIISTVIGIIGVAFAISVTYFLITHDFGSAVVNVQWANLTLYFYGIMGAIISYASLVLFKNQF